MIYNCNKRKKLKQQQRIKNVEKALEMQVKTGYVRSYFGQITWKVLLNLEGNYMMQLLKLRKQKSFK